MNNRKLVKSSALEGVPEKLNSESLGSMINLLDKLHVCCGQPDSHFVSMVNVKKGEILSSDGKIAACVNSFTSATLNGENYPATVRSSSCKLVSKSQKCSSC